MGIFELKSKDERRLKHMLKELGELNDSLGAKYSLRADLRDLTNRSFTVGKLLQEELDKIRDKLQFNIWLFDEADFKNMELYKILFKVTINAPLIWIATIANINLNRFSKLEQ